MNFSSTKRLRVSMLGPRAAALPFLNMFILEVSKFVVLKNLPLLRSSVKLHFTGNSFTKQGRDLQPSNC